MQNAEVHDKCHTVISNTFTGPMPASQSGLYREIQYLNNSSIPVYLKDNGNVIQEIKPSGMSSVVPHIEIRTRFVSGKRVDMCGNDISKGNHHIISIPIDVLQERPLYVASTDVAIMLGAFLYSTLHPHSDEYKQAEYDKLYADAMKSAQAAPFSVVANDPTGTFDKLYVLINDHICAVHVSSFQDENIGDSIKMYYKDVESPTGTHQRCAQSTFTDLKKEHDHIWDIEGCILSPRYEVLQYYLRNRHNDKDETISIQEAERRIKYAEEKHKTSQAEKDETIKQQTHKIKNMEAYIKEMENLGYSKASAQHQYDKLKQEKDDMERRHQQEKEKIERERRKEKEDREKMDAQRQHEREKMAREREQEEERLRAQRQHNYLADLREKRKLAQEISTSMNKTEDEIWKTGTAALKMIGVAIPILFSTYKLIRG